QRCRRNNPAAAPLHAGRSRRQHPGQRRIDSAVRDGGEIEAVGVPFRDRAGRNTGRDRLAGQSTGNFLKARLSGYCAPSLRRRAAVRSLTSLSPTPVVRRATASGVRPALFFALMSAPLSTRDWMRAFIPRAEAACSAVSPALFTVLMSPPRLMTSLTASTATRSSSSGIRVAFSVGSAL